MQAGMQIRKHVKLALTHICIWVGLKNTSKILWQGLDMFRYLWNILMMNVMDYFSSDIFWWELHAAFLLMGYSSKLFHSIRAMFLTGGGSLLQDLLSLVVLYVIFGVTLYLSNVCFSYRQNAILADEMGLGKTIQSIAFTCQMQVRDINHCIWFYTPFHWYILLFLVTGLFICLFVYLRIHLFFNLCIFYLSIV